MVKGPIHTYRVVTLNSFVHTTDISFLFFDVTFPDKSSRPDRSQMCMVANRYHSGSSDRPWTIKSIIRIASDCTSEWMVKIRMEGFGLGVRWDIGILVLNNNLTANRNKGVPEDFKVAELEVKEGTIGMLVSRYSY